jgi:hypothetical protein
VKPIAVMCCLYCMRRRCDIATTRCPKYKDWLIVADRATTSHSSVPAASKRAIEPTPHFHLYLNHQKCLSNALAVAAPFLLAPSAFPSVTRASLTWRITAPTPLSSPLASNTRCRPVSLIRAQPISAHSNLTGKILLGTGIGIPLVEVAKIVAQLNFDWCFIDAEHTPMGYVLVVY